MTETERAAATVQAVRAILGDDGDNDTRDPARVLFALRVAVATYYPPHDPSVVDLGGGMKLHQATDPAARLPPDVVALLSQPG